MTDRRERMRLMVSVYPVQDLTSEPTAILMGRIQTRRGGWSGTLTVVEAADRALCGKTMRVRSPRARSTRDMGNSVLASVRGMFPTPVGMVVGTRAA